MGLERPVRELLDARAREYAVHALRGIGAGAVPHATGRDRPASCPPTPCGTSRCPEGSRSRGSSPETAAHAVPGASVLVRQIVGTSSNPPKLEPVDHRRPAATRLSSRRTCSRDDLVISVYASGYVRSTAALTATSDVTHDVALSRGVTVSGIVTDSAGTAQKDVRVRAFQAGNLVLSTLTDAAGAYSLTLAPGTYALTAVAPAGQQMASVTVPNLALSGPAIQNFTLPSVGGSVTLKLYCGATYSGAGHSRGWKSARGPGPSRRSSERASTTPGARRRWRFRFCGTRSRASTTTPPAPPSRRVSTTSWPTSSGWRQWLSPARRSPALSPCQPPCPPHSSGPER